MIYSGAVVTEIIKNQLLQQNLRGFCFILWNGGDLMIHIGMVGVVEMIDN